MGDNHVCSFCKEHQQGKQHIKVVFENWPVDEEVIYRRKGKEVRRPRRVTKEVITVIGLECLKNPEVWKDYDVEPGKITDFFEDLRFAGKNPLFRAEVKNGIDHCLAIGCQQLTHLGESCIYIRRGLSQFMGLDELSCDVGHPGIILVRRKKEKSQGKDEASQGLWTFIKSSRHYFSLQSTPNATRFQSFYLWLTYSLPLVFFLTLYLAATRPLYWGYMLKNRLVLEIGRGKAGGSLKGSLNADSVLQKNAG